MSHTLDIHLRCNTMTYISEMGTILAMTSGYVVQEFRLDILVSHSDTWVSFSYLSLLLCSFPTSSASRKYPRSPEICNCHKINVHKYFTYIPVSCPSHYKEHKRDDVTICLGYSDNSMVYHAATSSCQTEGGDLIKVDSLDKFNILKEFLST